MLRCWMFKFEKLSEIEECCEHMSSISRKWIFMFGYIIFCLVDSFFPWCWCLGNLCYGLMIKLLHSLAYHISSVVVLHSFFFIYFKVNFFNGVCWKQTPNTILFSYSDKFMIEKHLISTLWLTDNVLLFWYIIPQQNSLYHIS